jgi:LysR family nitrogen assimilation transcriptional regulator
MTDSPPCHDARLEGGKAVIFEDLKVFVAVAKHGSFSQAAADLCTVQSALSRRVQRLEQRMGAPLFERRARGVELTPQGQKFLRWAQRLVAEIDGMERNLSSFAETPSGEVRIALPHRTCSLLVPPVIERCLAELPLVNLQVFEGNPSDVHGWVMREETDIAMTYSSELGPGYRTVPFMTEPLYLFYSTEHARGIIGDHPLDKCALADLARIPLILPRRPNVIRVLLDRLCASHSIRPHIRYEIDGPITTKAMVDRGLGATLFGMSTTNWLDSVLSGSITAVRSARRRCSGACTWHARAATPKWWRCSMSTGSWWTSSSSCFASGPGCTRAGSASTRHSGRDMLR